MINPRVTKAKPTDSFELIILFDNGETKLFDVKPYLNKGIFKQLNDKAFFNNILIENGTVTWNRTIDFCPDTLYLEGKLMADEA